jgi:site-specific DNA-methyltransferase (adenine-specific)
MKRIYFENETSKIINDDFINSNLIEENSIDLIVTSPPYNLDINYKSHDDSKSYDEFMLFCEDWLKQCLFVLKPDGRFCLNIPLDKNKGGQQSIGADITTLAKKVGWKYKSTIIWNEGNISRRTAWGSWLSASAPYVIAPVELIIVLYKDSWKKTSGSKISDIDKTDFMAWTSGVWVFSGESKKKIGHPSPFPIELPQRCIKLFSYVGDIVLDPFMGSGSTLVAAKHNGRIGVGVDIEGEYCEIAKNRVLTELPRIKKVVKSG